MTADSTRCDTWLAQPHHDGSARYVANQQPRLGDIVDVLVRVPLENDVDAVHVRTSPDGEQEFGAAQLVLTTATDAWWAASVTCHNPVTNYRFLLSGGPRQYAWLNGTGTHGRDVPDASDFRLLAHDAPPPGWALGSVVYQIFPDRFARSAGADRREQPNWAVPAEWADPVDTRPAGISQQLYGGDLDGVTEHLDHLQMLGVDVVYLTPFFPARSNHRYDAASFEAVDPVLGGDEALRRLTRSAHQRGLKVLGDFTTNHTGDAHGWFLAANGPGGESTPERDYYIWEEQDYVGWLGVRSLPKLNHRSEALRKKLFDAPSGVVRRWLAEAADAGDSADLADLADLGGLDGWRVDVANMTGRWRGTDLNREVARQLRDSMATWAPEALLVGEHVHDYTVDLPGDGWHGVMNYAGFCKPVWTWLRDAESAPSFLGAPVPLPLLDAGGVVETMRDFTSRVAWQSLVHSFNLVGSHDVTRVRTLVGGDGRGVDAAAGLLFTLPSMPMLTYGDEIGMEGQFGEDGRRPMPWSETDWDHRILEVYRGLIATRRSSSALRTGGLRWVHTDGDAIVYLREADDETALVHVARSAHEALTIEGRHLSGVETGRPAYGPPPQVEDGFVTLTATGPGVTVWTWKPSDGGACHRKRSPR
ncbi:MAG: glycoside hydrolase family 13 protein [Terracoccus sp.]